MNETAYYATNERPMAQITYITSEEFSTLTPEQIKAKHKPAWAVDGNYTLKSSDDATIVDNGVVRNMLAEKKVALLWESKLTPEQKAKRATELVIPAKRWNTTTSIDEDGYPYPAITESNENK